MSNPVLGLLIYFLYYHGATWTNGDYWLFGYQWQDIPVYNTWVDGDNKHGSSFGLIRRPFIGSSWSDGSLSGSRSLYCVHFSASLNSNASTRGCKHSNNIILGLLGQMGIIILMVITGKKFLHMTHLLMVILSMVSRLVCLVVWLSVAIGVTVRIVARVPCIATFSRLMWMAISVLVGVKKTEVSWGDNI